MNCTELNIINQSGSDFRTEQIRAVTVWQCKSSIFSYVFVILFNGSLFHRTNHERPRYMHSHRYYKFIHFVRIVFISINISSLRSILSISHACIHFFIYLWYIFCLLCELWVWFSNGWNFSHHVTNEHVLHEPKHMRSVCVYAARCAIRFAEMWGSSASYFKFINMQNLILEMLKWNEAENHVECGPNGVANFHSRCHFMW